MHQAMNRPTESIDISILMYSPIAIHLYLVEDVTAEQILSAL